MQHETAAHSQSDTLWVFHHSGRLERRVAPTIRPSGAAAARPGVSTSFRCGALKTRINLANYAAVGDFPWVIICEVAPRSLSDAPQHIWIAVQNTYSKDTKLPW